MDKLALPIHRQKTYVLFACGFVYNLNPKVVVLIQEHLL